MKKVIFMMAAVMGLFFTLTACAKKKENKSNMESNVKANDAAAKDSKVLVAYFSATGTTEEVAKMIAQATDGELYKIQPEEEYSAADLDWTVKTSRCCKENDNPKSRPAFKKTKENLDQYDVIYLGYPNWWNGAPRIINTFVEAYGLKGKTVIPFMTSGGSQIENSERLLKADYPEVNWQKGKLLNDATQQDVNAWVKSNK